MAKPRVPVGDIPRIRRQRTPRSIAEAWPTSAAGYHDTPTSKQAPATSSDNIGRLPVIGLDSGHIPGTRPDAKY